MKIFDIKKYQWEKYWAGNWSFSSAWCFGYYYANSIKKYMGENLRKAIVVSNHGYSYCYLDHKDRKRYGEFIGAKIGRNKIAALKFCNSLKKKADELVSLTRQLNRKKEITESDYKNFSNKFLEYAGPHVSVRHTVDFLSPDKLNELLGIFQEARLYVEKVYEETEKFIKSWAKQIGKRENLNDKLILCCTPDEMIQYYKDGQFPPKKVLENRYKLSCMIFYKKSYNILVGNMASKIDKQLHSNVTSKGLKGQIAYPGKARGEVRIIFNPQGNDAKKFKPGEILITGMTRPDFLPLMHKAGAIVTDGGGILSHAAITARELKKVTIIGTGSATKIFKNGDLVEVDANTGIVRKLEE